MSEHPVSEGGFCDIYVANMRGEGRVALKKLRLLGSHEKAAKVCHIFVLQGILYFGVSDFWFVSGFAMRQKFGFE